MAHQVASEENFCFCELAPLYALDALEEEERHWVEARIQEMPELADELTEYQATVATIPYGAPNSPMAGNLKDRLFHRLSLETEQSSLSDDSQLDTGGEAHASTGFTMQAGDLDWQPYDYPGVEIAQLYRDSIKREISCLIKVEAGVTYPEHRHEYLEELVMIEGELVMGDRMFGPGDYIRAEPNTIHPSAVTPQGCLFLLRSSLLRNRPRVVS